VKAAVAALLLLLAPVGVAAALDAPPTPTANAQLRTVPLTLTARGRARSYTVEVAATALEQDRGLMFRTRMTAHRGMIFPFEPPRTATFWMENTVLPLDLIFIAPDRRVLRIAADARPYSREIIASGGVVAAVLELNAGTAARIGLQPGDRVEYTLGR